MAKDVEQAHEATRGADTQGEDPKPDEKPDQAQHTEHPTGQRQAAENAENDPVG